MAALRISQAEQGAADKKPGARAPVRSGAAGLGAPLSELGVDDKLIKLHGADLKGAVAGLGKLVAAGAGVEAWQHKSYSRVLGQLHKVLGAQLSALPKPARAAAAKATVEAWAELAEVPEAQGRLPFVLSSASGLVDSALRMEARRKVSFTTEQMQGLAQDTAQQIKALIQDNVGRDGVSTMLNVLPRLVEELELSSKGLDGEQRAALVTQTRQFMQDVLPQSGTTLAHASDLARAVSVASRTTPGDSAKVFDSAKEDFLAPRREALQASQAKLGDAPKPELQHAFMVLKEVLAASPAGPQSLYEQVEAAKNTFIALEARAGADVAKQGVLTTLANMVRGLKDGPLAQAALQFVVKQGQVLVDRPDIAQKLGADVGDLKALAPGLLGAMNAVYARASGTPWNEAMKNLDPLSPTEAMAVALSHASVAAQAQSDGDLVWALSKAVRGGSEALVSELGSFAQRWSQSSNRVPADAQRGAVLAAIVGQGRGDAIPANQVSATANAAKQLAAQLPGADIASLIAPGAEGEPGLWELANPQGGWATQPLVTLNQLLAAGAGAKGVEPNDMARLAMQVAHNAAFIQNGAHIQVPRIVADFGAAAKNPANLKSAAMPKGQVALRAQAAKPNVVSFAKDHEALPVDFVFTAGANLTPAQMAWAVQQVDKSHGHDFVRMLRDCVFGCVESNRLDLMQGLVTSKSDSKATAGVIKEIAQAYRVRAMANVPFDALLEGLKAGEDPVARAAAAKAQAALGDLDLQALAGDKITAAGLEEVNSLADNIAELVSQYKTEFKSMDADIDMGKLRPVLDEVLKSVLQGSWPAPKYEDDVAQRQLAVLSPAQQAIWRQSTVISANAGPLPDPGPVSQRALTLLKGLATKVPEQIKLPKGSKFDAATADRLRGELDAVRTQLRDAKKGSAQHRELGAQAGPLALQLAVVELQVALAEIGPDADAVKTILDIAPMVPAAARALRKMGATGCSAALTEVGETAMDLKPQGGPGQGRWAADQDSLTAMIDSHKTGCLSKGDRRRRWGLAGSLSDANTKMLRVFNGDTQTYRTFVRMLPVKVGNYEGPGLFIENPVNDKGGTGDDRKLLDQALLEKARQMGVPVLGGPDAAPEGWKVIPKAQGTLSFDPGHTGLYHSDRTSQHKHQDAKEPWDYQFNGNGWQSMSVLAPPEIADKF